MLVYARRMPDGRLFEVRRAGRSLRLYTDGVFHTQYRPGAMLEDTVWDLLWLPARALPPDSVKRILVLGVGGGAVLHKLRRLYPQALMVGVDIEPMHLDIARTLFGLAGSDLRLHCADALLFMRYYQGPPFDLIVDDLFTDAGGEPHRVTPLDNAWTARLICALTPAGTLIANFAGQGEWRRAAPVIDPGRYGFTRCARLKHSGYDNRIGAFYRQAPDAAERRRLQRHSGRRVSVAFY